MSELQQRLESGLARSAGLICLHVDARYEPLRQDARFADLVNRIGLR